MKTLIALILFCFNARAVISTPQLKPCTENPNAAASHYLSAQEIRFLNLINAYRTQSGLQALRPSQCLTRPARWHSQDMGKKNYFDHADSLGRKWIQRMGAFGIANPSAENIAAGQETAEQVFIAWKNSPGHNKNMLSPNSKFIGIAKEPGRNSRFSCYWTTDFGR